MKKLIFILIFGITLLGNISECAAQGWERLFPSNAAKENTYAVKSIVLSNGDFLVLTHSTDLNDLNGNFGLLCLSPGGQVKWEKGYDFGHDEDPRDLIACSDGGYLILYNIRTAAPIQAVSDLKAGLLKLDAQFNTLFNQSQDLALTGWLKAPYSIFETASGYKLTGYCRHDPIEIPQENGFEAQYDFQGNVLSTQLMFSGDQSGASTSVLNPDGTSVSCGPSCGVSQSCLAMVKRSADGTQQLWEQQYTDLSGAFYQANTLLKAPDGGYLLAGGENSQAFLLRVDENGTKLWEKKYQFIPDGFLWIVCATVLKDGSGYAFLAHDGTYIPKFVLVKTDLQGQIVFSKKLGMTWTYNYAHHIASLPDQGFLIAASRNPSPVLYAQQVLTQAAYVLRIDANGNGFGNELSGSYSYDSDNDCVADLDSSMSGSLILAYKNGQNIGVAQADTNGLWSMPVDTGFVQIIPQNMGGPWTFCPGTLQVQVSSGDSLSGLDFTAHYQALPIDSIFGYVFEDVDGDCLRDSFETVYPGWTIKLNMDDSNGGTVPFSAVSDANGRYVFYDIPGFTNAASGIVMADSDPVDGLGCVVTCEKRQFLRFNPGGTSFQADFGVHCDSLPPCAGMEVDIATTGIRPCFVSQFHVNYCNNGALPAENAYITVTLDSVFQVNGASLPYTTLPDNSLRFDLGDVPSEACGNFTIDALALCDPAITGQTFCVEAHAYPDSSCIPPGIIWDGSEVSVSGHCEQDSVIFIITNIGSTNMQESLDYIVIEDNVLFHQGTFLLPAGESKRIALKADGHFYRLATQQANGLPVLNQPVAWVESCGNTSGGPVSLGFVNQFSLGDQDTWLDIFCLQSTNSYDPNDKTGFPLGVHEERLIEQNTELEYFIRFQNTGTAPAINVEIRDTLPAEFLDFATLRPGAASHPYTFDMQGNNVVSFKFNNIGLPDSSSNEAASHGFVKFRVSQKKDLPLGTKIKNQAGIFFDFNPPVITNQTLHTVGKDFLLTRVFIAERPGIECILAPNPLSEQGELIVKGRENDGQRCIFRVFNSVGQAVLEKSFTGNKLSFETASLVPGAYFFELYEDGSYLGTGRFVRVRH